MVINSTSEQDTLDAGQRFGKTLERGDIVCLKGDLGAGKTHFVKGMAGALEVDPERVSSPTYALINEYQGKVPVYHFDCYRLNSEAEALDIGIEEYMYGTGITIIEWPEIISGLIPEDAYLISIKHKSNNERTIIFHQEERDGSH